MDLNISIENALQGIIKIGVVGFDQVKVKEKINQLVQEMEALATALRSQYKTPADALEKLKTSRALYRKIGIDPTKTRPSSEALLRRVLKNKPLYQINSVVDICNLCSLTFFLSIGLYDRGKIQGPIQLRLGKTGERYDGIRKDSINVEGRLTLADDRGPFGNPSADSARSMITPDSTKILFVVFAPRDYASDLLQDHLMFIERKMLQYHRCQSVGKQLLPTRD